MSTSRPPLLLTILLLAVSVLAQTRGGGGGSRSSGSSVQPGTNARNAAVLGTGDNLDLTLRPGSAADEAKVEFRSQSVLVQVPVVVTDKSGSHLHGLKKGGFQRF